MVNAYLKIEQIDLCPSHLCNTDFSFVEFHTIPQILVQGFNALERPL